jgi:hypothetical protein
VVIVFATGHKFADSNLAEDKGDKIRNTTSVVSCLIYGILMNLKIVKEILCWKNSTAISRQGPSPSLPDASAGNCQTALVDE